MMKKPTKPASDGPVDDPDQFVISEFDGDPGKYLGNHHVTAKLFHDFARQAVLIYDDFLRGQKDANTAERETVDLIQHYADIYNGKTDYVTAEWMDGGLKGRLHAWLDILGSTGAYKGYFTFLADQCHEAAKAMVRGMDEKEAGAQLAEIVEDGIGRFMYIIR